MNDTLKPEVQPEVDAFVVEVERRLTDLSAEERDELVGGLRADLAERLAEHVGPEAAADVLGDPADYAAELRAAAGFAAFVATRPDRRPVATVVGDWLDAGKRTWVELVDKVPGAPREFLESLRPVWWVLRAWVAWMVAHEVVSGGAARISYDVPWLVLLLALVVGSVQVGRGGGRMAQLRGHVVGRLLLIGLNLLAICLLPNAVDRAQWGIYDDRLAESGYGASNEYGTGLVSDGVALTNVFPYDAAGKPLTGVQLFDADGRPLAVDQALYEDDYTSIVYPWLSNGTPRFNTFPLPVGDLDLDTGERIEDPWSGPRVPVLPPFPFPLAPSVGLPQPAPVAME